MSNDLRDPFIERRRRQELTDLAVMGSVIVVAGIAILVMLN